MKKTSKKLNIISTVIILTMLFACAISVTLSYFTATATATGSITFYDLTVDCIVQSSSGTDCTFTDGAANLEFSSSSVARGGYSMLKQSNKTDVQVGLKLHDSTSCACYVRMWIDVYVGTGNSIDTNTNYGQYLTLKWYNGSSYTDGNLYHPSNSNVYYLMYSESSSNPSLSNTSIRWLFNAVQLNDDNATAALVGSDITIKFSYEAIQATNGAVSTWAADSKGKYSYWS